MYEKKNKNSSVAHNDNIISDAMLNYRFAFALGYTSSVIGT